MEDLSQGVFTFLFTDIEGSIALWEHHPSAMRDALRRHNTIIRDAIESHHGRVFKTVGDEFCTVFSDPTDALTAALSSQRSLHSESWPEEIGELRVRMALHTGLADVEYRDYFGPAVNRVARLESAAHGGQVLLSEVTSELVAGSLPKNVDLVDLGRHRLRDLIDPEQIFQLSTKDLPKEFLPPRSQEIRLHNLPKPTTLFIGRQTEIDDLDRLLSQPDNRLISIIGPGGIGKTRLALEVAERQLAARTGENGQLLFSNGVFFVPLFGVESVEGMVLALADALAFRPANKDPAGRPPEIQILDFLRQKRMLLLLDNYEQLLPDTGLLSAFLEQAHDLKLLITSREPLSLHSEKRYQLSGMRYPTESAGPYEPESWLEEYSSIALLVNRIQRIHPEYRLVLRDMNHIARICHLVDGMPLAIELAGGWLDSLSLEEVSGEISNDLDILETDHHDMPDRHRSIRAVFESTWQLLAPAEQTLFMQLTVYRGAFSRPAAEVVAQTNFRALSGLVSRSLLNYDPDTRQFRIHRLLREFGSGKLVSKPSLEKEARDRHATYYLDQAASLWREVKTGRRYDSLIKLDLDVTNALTAFHWSVSRGRGSPSQPGNQRIVWSLLTIFRCAGGA